MFEEYTQEYLTELMLEKGQELDVSVIEGSLCYNAACLMAVMLEDAFDKAEEIYINAFPDTCDREHLIRLALDRGISPKSAQGALYQAVANIPLASEAELICEAVSFSVEGEAVYSEELGGYLHYIRCSEVGSASDGFSGELQPTESTEGFESCVILRQLTQGRQDESTQELRERYFESFAVSGQFGNRAYYYSQCEKIDGVGAIYFEVKNTAGGKVVVIKVVDTGGCAAGAELLSEVENKVSAAVGQTLEVTVPQATAVDITVSVSLRDTGTFEDAVQEVEQTVDAYLKEINLALSKEGTRKLRLMAIPLRLIESEYIEECEIEPVSGSYDIAVPEGAILTKGTVTVNEI